MHMDAILHFHLNIIVQKKDFFLWYYKEIYALSLHEKCPYSEYFLSVVSRIRIAYGEIFRMSRIQPKCGKIRTRKNPNGYYFRIKEKYQYSAHRISSQTNVIWVKVFKNEPSKICGDSV